MLPNARGEVFVTAFRTLTPSEQRVVLSSIMQMRKWRKDLLDIAVAELRSREKSRPLREFLGEIKHV